MKDDVVFEVTSFYKEKERIISLVFKNDEDENKFGSIVFSDGGQEYSFSIESSKFIVPLDSIGNGCLLACGIGLAGPIIDCFRKHKNSWKKFKKCLKGQGVTLALTTLTCIDQCIKANDV